MARAPISDATNAVTSKPTFQTPTIGDVLGTPPAGGYVVPGFSTDSSGNIVTAANVGTVQAQANAAATAAAANDALDPTRFAADWYKAFFQQYGLPGDVQSSILGILKQYASDPATAQALAQQYLRTTDWYQQTFPGFAAGQRNGLFTDETGYRGYLNQVNQLFNQYLGRHVSSDEISGYLASGYAPSHIGNLLQGQAWASANGNDVRRVSGSFGETGAFSDADLAALGNEHSGIDSARGQSLDAMLARAQQRLQGIFQGRLADPGLTLGANGLSASGLAGRNRSQDVGAA